MSKIMDRIYDLNAIDWTATTADTLAHWELEALHHVKECRCHKCAVFFARNAPCDGTHNKNLEPHGSAIPGEVIMALRLILKGQNKLNVHE